MLTASHVTRAVNGILCSWQLLGDGTVTRSPLLLFRRAAKADDSTKKGSHSSTLTLAARGFHFQTTVIFSRKRLVTPRLGETYLEMKRTRIQQQQQKSPEFLDSRTGERRENKKIK
ncbi:hypothetical protein NPIL_95271 [Nephila pilipes]|uniref:Uncharacterized protein n=1 Tax=Nephila pilipes TaxID=299642 RepID=A0A8X6P733_NEPPI|nr:hypothetical protein NPIL_95271 [Nephila pilipes]